MNLANYIYTKGGLYNGSNNGFCGVHPLNNDFADAPAATLTDTIYIRNMV